MIKVVYRYSLPQIYIINQAHTLGTKTDQLLPTKTIEQRLANAEGDLQNLIIDAKGCHESQVH